MSDIADDDWRVLNAQRIKGQKLKLRPYFRWSDGWDHDHCTGCWVTFAMIDGPDIQHEGYATSAEYDKGEAYEWVCKECFAALKDKMDWTVVD